MPNIKCTCGNIIKAGQIPNPNEWLIISDVEYDNYSGKIDAEKLYKDMKTLLKCGSCNRIWIYWDGFEKDPISYTKE